MTPGYKKAPKCAGCGVLRRWWNWNKRQSRCFDIFPGGKKHCSPFLGILTIAVIWRQANTPLDVSPGLVCLNLLIFQEHPSDDVSADTEWVKAVARLGILTEHVTVAARGQPDIVSVDRPHR